MGKAIVKEIFLDSNSFETRIAIREDDNLAEFYVERKGDRGLTGNIYKGKVVRVLPGMQAAFVELGLDRTAFLHVSDVTDPTEVPDDDAPYERGRRRERSVQKIQDLLKAGQEVVVQVEKEPIGTKGARLTSYVSIPGRYLVFMPTYDKVGVSRKIEGDRERRRLKDIVARLRPKGSGFIIRTVCESRSKEELGADMEFLLKLWNKIIFNKDTLPNPSLLYEELDITLRTVRDIFTKDVKRFVIDSEAEYDKVIAFMDEFMPDLKSRVELYKGDTPAFDALGIEVELAKALEKNVWLPSGGSIVIDQMEALTAIDVNTGRYVGKKNSEQTILKTNLEALDEVVRQVRLRNIGGIIVIDFIDMSKISNREMLYDKLKEALKADKARTNILKVSELGIIEMTRKRTRESITQSLLEACPYCDGDGLVKGKDTVIMEIYRELLKTLLAKRRKAILYVNPGVAERIKEPGSVIHELAKRYKKKLVVKPVESFHQEEYEIV